MILSDSDFILGTFLLAATPEANPLCLASVFCWLEFSSWRKHRLLIAPWNGYAPPQHVEINPIDIVPENRIMQLTCR